MLKKLLIIGLFLVSMFGFSFAKDYIFFYGQGCSHCAKVEAFFKEHKVEEKFTIVKKEVYFDRKNTVEFNKYCTQLNVNTDEQAVPFLVINDGPKCEYRVGDTPIIQYFKNEMGMATTDSEKKDESTGMKIDDKGQTKLDWKFLGIMIPAAISDSINPCEFAIMLLLLSSIIIKHKSRQKAVIAGLAFSLAIFVSYYLMGLGLYKALSQASNVFYLKLFVGILGIVVGLANLKDYFWYGKWFVMEVPFSRRPKMAELVQGITSPIGAFVIGLVVSLFLLPCTSGPYLTILGVLSAESQTIDSRVYLFLAIYNIFFVLPMLGITALVGFGFKSIEDLNRMKEDNKLLIHLLVGILMILLGVYVLLNNFGIINF